MTSRGSGYSLIEMLVAMALVSAFAAGAFRLIDIAHQAAGTGAEVADMLQRLRGATATLEGELLRAGAGASNAESDALSERVPAVFPYRPGDPAGTFRSDVITVVYARQSAAQTTTAVPLTSTSDAFRVNQVPGCPQTQPACGLKVGDTAVVFDRSGNFDAFSITGVAGDAGAMTPLWSAGSATAAYDAGSSIVPVERRTYALKTDAAGRPYELVSYEGESPAAIPLAEHIVALKFDYFDDPASLTPMIRPNDNASLLRVRAVGVTLRVEAATDAMRGAAGALFVRPGTASDLTRTLADVEAHFHVSLRNVRAAE